LLVDLSGKFDRPVPIGLVLGMILIW